MIETKEILKEVKDFFIKSGYDFPQADEQLLKAHLKNDIGLDSIEVIEAVINLEKEFNVVVSDDVLERIKTVEDLINSVNGK